MPSSPDDNRIAATNKTRQQNAYDIYREGRGAVTIGRALKTTRDLADELQARGIKGFKRGGRVHRTGIYKLHRGERVIRARTRRGHR